MMNGLDFNVEKMLDLASKECSNIVGVKYTGQDIEKYSQGFFQKYNVLIGAENMLDRAFKIGADGAIGITFNFCGQTSRNIYDAV